MTLSSRVKKQCSERWEHMHIPNITRQAMCMGLKTLFEKPE